LRSSTTYLEPIYDDDDNINTNGIANVFISGGGGNDHISIDDSQLSVLLGDEGSIDIKDQYITSSITQLSYYSYSLIGYVTVATATANTMYGNDELTVSTTLLSSNQSQTVIFGGQDNDTIITHNVCAAICGDDCSCTLYALYIHIYHRRPPVILIHLFNNLI
jgi:PKD repeat protein